MPDPAVLYNPHLEGEAFYWAGGDQGVLLIHGFTATTAEVRPLGKILNQHGYTVSGPLLPGHNTHPDDLNRVSWKDWVEAVETAYQHLKSSCRTVFLGGESTGGLLALFLAIQHPEAAGILAYAPALRLTISRYDTLRLHIFAPFKASVPKQSIDGSDRWQGYPVNPLKGTLQLLKLQEVVYPRLSEIKQPLLVVQGRLDTTVHPDVPELIASQVSSKVKEIHWMEHSAHTVILEGELDEVGVITLEFLARIAAPSI